MDKKPKNEPKKIYVLDGDNFDTPYGNDPTWKANKKKYIQQYTKENIKRVPLDMQISDYARLKAHTESTGETVNGFIKRAINETIQRDTAKENN